MEVGGREYDILDFPEDGMHREGNTNYDLNSFNKFYDEYGTKYDAASILGYSTEKIDDVKLDGKPARLTAEAASFLSFSSNIDGTNTISFADNISFTKTGTSLQFNSVDRSDYLVPLNRIWNSIHTHPAAGTYSFRYTEGNLISYPFREAVRGPSRNDFKDAYGRKGYNVMVDDRFIYLYNYNRDMFIYRRK